MYKASSYTLLKCIVFSVVWTCCWGKKSPKSQFYGASGWLVRCWRVASKGVHFLLWQAAKPSGLKCTNVLYGVEMLRW